MDRLDIRILRELTQAHTVWPARPGFVPSYRFVARRIGASPGTVRNRVREMIRTGFLLRISAYANPNLLGLGSGSYAVEVSSGRSKADVMEKIAQLGGVVFFEDFRGPLLGMALTFSDSRDLERKLARIDQISGSSRGLFSRVEHPPAPGRLTRSEWALVGRLMAGNFRTYEQLAREFRVSSRTIKRRLARLAENGAILTFPRMDYRALVGGVTAELIVAFEDRATKAEAEGRILHLLDDWMIYAGVWEEFEIFRLILPNVSKASEVAERVGHLDGIRFARVEFVERLVDHLDALRPFVEQRVSESSRATSVPAAV